jgi:hypothetical protein
MLTPLVERVFDAFLRVQPADHEEYNCSGRIVANLEIS